MEGLGKAIAALFVASCVASAVAGILIWKLVAWIIAHLHLAWS